MSSELVIRDLFRSLETTIHERLSMIAEFIRIENLKGGLNNGTDLSTKLNSVLEAIQAIDARLTSLELKKAESQSETVHVNHIGKPLSSDIWSVNAMPGLEINLNEPIQDYTIPMNEDNSVFLYDKEVVEEEVEEEVEEVKEDSFSNWLGSLAF